MKLIYLLIFFSIIISSCSNENDITSIEHNSPQIHYMGRITQTDTANIFHWSGTSAEIIFKGTKVSATFQDERGDNYYNIIIDKDSIIVIRPNQEKELITLAENLSNTEHTLEIFKRTEWDRGKTYFYGFKIDGKILPPTPVRKRKIEFYGNSITCGYGIEDYSGKDRSDSIFTNNYPTYAARTARYFDAEYHCISKSGIGITVSWFPTIMPDIYNLTDPTDSLSLWKFVNYQPDLVVINLFQNDSWLVNKSDHDSFKKYFGTQKPSDDFIINAYKDFVSSLRSEYQDASIICTLGNMDATKEGSEWPTYVETAVSQLNDDKLYTYFMPYKDTPGHPKIEEHEIMAKGLIKFIEENIQW